MFSTYNLKKKTFMKNREKQNWQWEHTQKHAICECTTFGFYQWTNQIIDRSLSINQFKKINHQSINQSSWWSANQLKNKSIDLSISQPKF